MWKGDTPYVHDKWWLYKIRDDSPSGQQSDPSSDHKTTILHTHTTGYEQTTNDTQTPCKSDGKWW